MQFLKIINITTKKQRNSKEIKHHDAYNFLSDVGVSKKKKAMQLVIQQIIRIISLHLLSYTYNQCQYQDQYEKLRLS